MVKSLLLALALAAGASASPLTAWTLEIYAGGGHWFTTAPNVTGATITGYPGVTLMVTDKDAMTMQLVIDQEIPDLITIWTHAMCAWCTDVTATLVSGTGAPPGFAVGNIRNVGTEIIANMDWMVHTSTWDMQALYIVPEPATYWMSAAGLIALGLLRRRATARLVQKA